MTRSEMRESAFKLIFEKLFRDDSEDEILEIAAEAPEIIVTPFVEELFRGVYAHTDELDGIIAEYSDKRRPERIPKVNLAVLRLALYEIIYGGTEMNIAISEAVIIVKKYAYEADVAFVNGVLGSYSRSVGGEAKCPATSE